MAKLWHSQFLGGRILGTDGIRGGLHVLACKRHAEIALIDAICKARQWRCKAYDQSNDSTPVCAEFGRIAVDAVEFVHVWYGNIATTGDVVAVINVLVMWYTLVHVWKQTYSVMIMAVIGPRKMVYPLKKDKNF